MRPHSELTIIWDKGDKLNDLVRNLMDLLQKVGLTINEIEMPIPRWDKNAKIDDSTWSGVGKIYFIINFVQSRESRR